MWHIENVVHKWAPIGFALAIIFVVFLPSLTVGFFADDYDFVVRLQEAPLREMVTHSTDGTIGGGSWRPITMIFFWLTMSFGQGALFNHIVSLGVYIGMLGVLYVCIRELFPERSNWFAALTVLVVGLMPIHAEPVVWVAARADLIAALAGLAALAAWLRGYGRWAVIFLVLSLGAKEFWLLFSIPLFFLTPTSHTMSERYRFFGTFVAAAVGWFLVRFFITRYGLGGYSITASQQVLGVQHLANEVISFVVGSWNFGVFQSWIIRFSQYYWFIAAWIVAAVCGLIGYVSVQHKRSRFLYASLVSVQIPSLLLGVSFIRPEASVGEQRYWFAGSIFLVLLAAHFLKKYITIVTACVVMIYFLGITTNIGMYRTAALYRDSVLSGWKSFEISDSSTTRVAFLPDSWYGVHLLASPFFERALENEKLPKPRSVSTWYQQCTVHCLTPASVQEGLHGSVRLFAQDPRIFSQTSHGLRYDAAEQLEPGTTLAIWSGTKWIEISSEIGENCLH